MFTKEERDLLLSSLLHSMSRAAQFREVSLETRLEMVARLRALYKKVEAMPYLT